MDKIDKHLDQLLFTMWLAKGNMQALKNAVLNTNGLVLIGLTREGIITYTNHTFTTTIGYTYSELVGKKITEFLTDEYKQKGADAIETSIKGENLPNVFTAEYLCKDKKKRKIHWFFSNMSETNDNPDLETLGLGFLPIVCESII